MNSQQIAALVALWQIGGIAERNFDEMNAEIDEEQMAKNAQYAAVQDAGEEQS